MKEICKEIRRHILDISHNSGHGHIPTCFSVVEILYAIYKCMQHDAQNPSWKERDIFVLSKGHASLALYCILAHWGYFTIGDVYSFGSFGSDFGCHADRKRVPGIEASTGSLGHGIGLAVGMALASKLKGNPRRIYTLIGDGEANEGTIWEAILVAESRHLDNLTIVYDNNRSHARGLQISNPEEKLKAFGCDVSVVDGHDIEHLKSALSKEAMTVKAVVANTVKGFGCRELSENHYAWHRRSPNGVELRALVEELNA